ncbi:MAG: nitroreductase family protein [Actinobacteria bacterium]|nr:nitroreductase family protein [Actinomycetota bacterium]
MEFETLVRSRRMRRSFNDVPVDRRVIEQCVDLARLSPSAGKSQGWNLVVLEGSQTEKFWSCTLPVERRSTFAWPGLLRAPVIAIALADPTAYVERYSEADKAHTGLGNGPDAWSVKYWTVDASFAVMTLLYALDDAGLGALFFAIFNGEQQLRESLGIPAHLEIIGAIATGVPDGSDAPGRSAARPSRVVSDFIHWGTW